MEKEKERFIPRKGMQFVDEDGKTKIRMRIIRPITDPEWNRRQMGKRVRMSKKERLRQRHEIERAAKPKTEA
ncbi:MAG: hypothetical protein IJI83_03655 [Oscillospiraceae bacterium]|nr:hypothetical protein [Oscillospiraceae bacterium]